MTVYYDKKEKGYKYHFQYKGKNYKSKKYKTRKQAEMAEKRKRRELSGDLLLLSDLVRLRLEDYAFHDQNQTAAKIEQVYRCRVKNFVKDKDVSEYTPEDIEHLAHELKKAGQSNYSIDYTVKYLGSIFRWGMKKGYCKYDPTIYFEKLKYTKEEKEYWTREQFEKAMTALPPEDYKMRALIETLFWTGMRKSEARGLKYSDLDLDSQVITIRRHIVEDGGHAVVSGRKNGNATMDITIDDGLAEVLREMKRRDQQYSSFSDDWYLFGTTKPFTLSTLAKRLDKMAAETGVPRVTPHGLRHSHVSWLRNVADLTYEEIAERIGDTSDAVKNFYFHLYDENKVKIGTAINDYKKKEMGTSGE